MHDLMRTTITSMEAAEWCGKKHNELLKDIRRYISQLGEGKIPHTDFFKESTYVTGQNKTLPCFLVTKNRPQDDRTEGNGVYRKVYQPIP